MIRSLLALTLVALFSLPSQAQEEISVDEFLKEVRTKNQAVAGALLSSEGSQARSKEGEMMTTTALFAEAEFASDAKLPVIAITSYDRIEQHKYSLGLKKAFSFGLEAKLYYLVLHTNYVNMTAPFPITAPNFFDVRPTLEFSQQLWGNGLGRTTRAKQEQIEAGNLANSFKSRFEARTLLNSAEEAFWNLSLMRERTEVARLSLEQSRKIHKWNAERVRRNLADDVDELQARAAMEVAELEYQTAVDMERMACRTFNKFRNVVSDEVSLELPELQTEALLNRRVAEAKPERDDVKAAEQAQKAAIAGGLVAKEALRPSLEMYGMFGANGRDFGFGPSLINPYQAGRSTFAFGLRFNMPLDRSLASEAMAGVVKEQMAAEMSFHQKQTDVLQDFQDLSNMLKELRNRLKLTRTIAEAQKTKLDRERTRLTSGRTTTFQVLSFEQDYARSRLAEISAKLELVRALTKMKLYGGTI
jgi:outer membrane protein TolC